MVDLQQIKQNVGQNVVTKCIEFEPLYVYTRSGGLYNGLIESLPNATSKFR